MSYGIMRFEKCKRGDLNSRQHHNERTKEVYKSNPDIDTEKSKENYYLYHEEGKSYVRLCDEAIREHGCKRVRKDSTYAVEVLFSSSPEHMKSLTPSQQQRFFEECFKFIGEEFGKGLVFSAVVHMDESTPHMHLLFHPITQDGRLSAKDLLGNPKTMSKHQDNFYNFMHEKFPELDRGISAIETMRKHVPTWVLKQAPQMDKLFTKINKAVEDINLLNMKAQKESVKKMLARMLPKAKKFSAEVDKIDNYLKSCEQKIETLEQQIEDVQRRNSELNTRMLHIVNDNQYYKSILNRIPPEVIDEFTRPAPRQEQTIPTKKKRNDLSL